MPKKAVRRKATPKEPKSMTRAEAIRRSIAMHEQAIAGVERARVMLGNDWADKTIAYRRREIARLKAEQR